MTAPLGTKTCISLGCDRRRETAADARIVYAHCEDHRKRLTAGAFGKAA
jgi:hypothetical protein